jgi:hypothetical protein
MAAVRCPLIIEFLLLKRADPKVEVKGVSVLEHAVDHLQFDSFVRLKSAGAPFNQHTLFRRIKRNMSSGKSFFFL